MHVLVATAFTSVQFGWTMASGSQLTSMCCRDEIYKVEMKKKIHGELP